MRVRSKETAADLRRTIAELQRQLAERSTALSEALEQQAATAEVLQVINASPGELAPVFDAMLEKALRLCGAAFGILWTYDGNRIDTAATRGFPAELAEYRARHPDDYGPRTAPARILSGERVVHIADLTASADDKAGVPQRRAFVDLGGARSLLAVPLLRDDRVAGSIMIYRQQPGAFSDKQIALLQNFAAQAVIAADNARLINEQREALEQQVATAEVLQVINSSPGNLAPVFAAILEKAHNLCGATHGSLMLYDGDRFRAVAVQGLSDKFAERLRQGYSPGPNHPSRQLLEGARFGQRLDSRETDDPIARAAAELGGIRTTLFIPLRKDGALLGQIVADRQEVRPFTEKEITLLESFAAQAVIAMENARLMTETREALERQTATAEVLQVINRSPGDLAPIFDAILAKAHNLCAVAHGSLHLYDGATFRAVAVHGLSGAFADRLRQGYTPGPSNPARRLLEGARFAHIPDLNALDDPTTRAAVELNGIRTALFVPLRKDDTPLGMIVAARREVRPFSEKEIALLESFAAQAVIAIENARLMTETREALEQQTATAEVLQVINRSPGDLAPVFAAILEKAHSLCGVSHGSLQLYDGELLRAVAVHGLSEAFADRLRQGYKPGSQLPVQRLLEGARFAQVADLGEINDPTARAAAELSSIRTTLFIPLRKEGTFLGQVVAARQEVRPFSEKEIALLESFAAQAVIAMENARLMTETREALERQTATAEVLQVINRSPGDLTPVFDAILENAHRLCAVANGSLQLYDGETFRAVAVQGHTDAFADRLRQGFSPGAKHPSRRLIDGEHFAHVDLGEIDDPTARAAVALSGMRTALFVPLRKDGALLGQITASRREVRPFTEKEIALLESFAAQAVIAIENARLLAETREALEQQTATAEVLQVINRSPGDLAPVLTAMLDKAMRLCEAALGHITTFDGELFHHVVARGDPDVVAFFRQTPVLRGSTESISLGRILNGERLVHIADCRDTDEYRDRPVAREIVDRGGMRTLLSVALRKDERLLGTIHVYRHEVRSFSDKQIALLESFAAQAVIAMENARLMTETRQSLEQQTATAEVLGVINSSPGNLAPVFEAMLDKALRLCEASFGVMQQNAGDHFRAIAWRNVPPSFLEFLTQPLPVSPGGALDHLVRGESVVHVADIRDEEPHLSGNPGRRALVDLAQARTVLWIPLRKDGTVLGAFVIYRTEVRSFTAKQITLVQSFAAQAVIAMENARLLGELRQRTGDLQEALEYQTATGEVLRVVASAPDNLQSVFDAMLEKAVALCDAKFGSLFLRDAAGFRVEADRNVPPDYARAVRGRSFSAEENTGVRRLVESKAPLHLTDIIAAEGYDAREPLRVAAIELGGVRSMLAVPLLNKGELLGWFSIYRAAPGGFAQNQIALVTTFADQAVIAIENARLITETREALERQTATADVLRVISSSPGELAPVFDTMLANAARLCEAQFGTMNLYNGATFQTVAVHNVPAGVIARRGTVIRPHPESGLARGARTKQIVQVADIRTERPYLEGDPAPVALADIAGARTIVVVPMLKENELVGMITIYRQEVRPFTDRQIALLESFAAQAVIAIENARLITETREALERQTATAEVLRVINSSPGELTPVFDAILEKAHSLCDVSHGSLQLYDGERFRAVAVHGLADAFADRLRQGYSPGQNHPSRQLLEGVRFAQRIDAAELEEPIARAAAELSGIRTTLFIPLRKDGRLLGQIAASRREVKPFVEKEIALLESFAAQAVIAIENARLLTETREALERQTATAEVLQIINSSPGELEPVFEAMLANAARLCEATFGTLLLYDGEAFRQVALHNPPPGFAVHLGERIRPHPESGRARVARTKQVVHIADLRTEPPYLAGDPSTAAIVDLAGARTIVMVPMLKEDQLVGAINIYRQEVRPFTERQIDLVKNFATQAVIAIENARLLKELRQRTEDLSESLRQQTATADVLKVISRSSVDLETVLDLMAETVTRLCRADHSILVRRKDDGYHMVASRGLSPEAKEFILAHPLAPDRGTVIGRAALERRIIHVADILQDPEYTYTEGQKITGYRTMLGIPLLREDTLIGVFSVNRTHVERFTQKEIELAASFADQAVIAIENARLFEELRERQAELARSVDELTATGDVLKIISRSSVDLETVLDTLTETVARLCRADQSYMFRRREEKYHLITSCGLSDEAKEFIHTHPFAPDRGSLSGRVEMERRAVHIPDVLQDPEYTYPAQKIAGYRTILGVPLLRGDELIGIFAINRTRVEPFTEKEIELASTFADQAVIAIENARLFEELRERQAELSVTFDNMGDGVAMFDAGSRLVAWNRNFQEMLDLPDAFLAQRPTLVEYFRYLSERGEYSSAELEAELRRGIEDTGRELRFERTRPDGRVMEVRRNPVPGGGFVVIFSDVTDRKRAEEAIRTARDAAETALRDLQTAQASLLHSQKMAALGQLTAGIAHEIKNPLNFVNNFAGLSVELLNELTATAAPGLAALDAAKRAEIEETVEMLTGNLAKIAEHGRRADGIVKSMLAHSRGTSGDRQTVDINGLVEEALNLAYHGARAQDQSFNVTLERDLATGMAPIEVVPQDITRVFLNLIGNGFYAAHKRRQQTGDGTFKPTLRVSTREQGGALEITVRDNGIGIAPEHREKLFQPFFTTKPTGEGTGLGLSISYDIVTQEHGGTIAVESRVGEFTEFTVRLPRGGVRRKGVA